MQYINRFIKEKIMPYRQQIEVLPIEYRQRIRHDVEKILNGNIYDFCDGSANPVIPEPNGLDEITMRAFTLTAQLGFDIGRLWCGESQIYQRYVKDYVILMSEILSSFGEYKKSIKARLTESLKDSLELERRKRIELRHRGIGPKQLAALWN